MRKSFAVIWLSAFGVMAILDSSTLLDHGAWLMGVILLAAWLILVGLFLVVGHWDWVYPRLPRWITGAK